VAVRRAAGDARGRRRRQRGARVRARIDRVRSAGRPRGRRPLRRLAAGARHLLGISPVRAHDAPEPAVRGCVPPGRPRPVARARRARGRRDRARLLRPAVHGGVVRGAVHPPRGGSGRCRGPGGGDSVTLSSRDSPSPRVHGAVRHRFRRRHPRVQLPADRLAPHLPVRGVRADGRSRFGERRILGHSEEYTLELALRSNGYALWYLATRWVVAGPLGTLLAFAGGGHNHAALAVGRRALAEGTAAWNLSPNGASSEPRGSCSPVSSSPSSSGTSSSGGRTTSSRRSRTRPTGWSRVSDRSTTSISSSRCRSSVASPSSPAAGALSASRVARLSGHARICAGDRRRGRGTRALRRSARCRGCGRGPARSARGIRRQVRGGLRADRVRVVRRRPRVRPHPVRRVAQHPFQSLRNDPGWTGRSCTRSTATRPRISR